VTVTKADLERKLLQRLGRRINFAKSQDNCDHRNLGQAEVGHSWTVTNLMCSPANTSCHAGGHIGKFSHQKFHPKLLKNNSGTILDTLSRRNFPLTAFAYD